jgi:hypothetical protein
MPDDFALFWQATRDWLARAPSLDPSLAAALDVLRGNAAHYSDAHAILAEHTLYSLWKACATGELERV